MQGGKGTGKSRDLQKKSRDFCTFLVPGPQDQGTFKVSRSCPVPSRPGTFPGLPGTGQSCWNPHINHRKLKVSILFGLILVDPAEEPLLKFIYSEKATKFCEISTVDLTIVIELLYIYVHYKKLINNVDAINRRLNERLTLTMAADDASC